MCAVEVESHTRFLWAGVGCGCCWWWLGGSVTGQGPPFALRSRAGSGFGGGRTGQAEAGQSVKGSIRVHHDIYNCRDREIQQKV